MHSQNIPARLRVGKCFATSTSIYISWSIICIFVPQVQHSQSQVLEKVRERMYALRQTWNEVFPPSKMYALDVQVKRLDNNWPITAKQPTTSKIHVNPAIHVNPDFLKTVRK